MPRLGSWVRIPSPAPDFLLKNRRECSISCASVPASNGLNEPRTVPNCVQRLGKRWAERSCKVPAGLSLRTRKAGPAIPTAPRLARCILWATRFKNALVATYESDGCCDVEDGDVAGRTRSPVTAMVGKRRHTARNRPASAPLPIDLRRFAAKHADEALSANLASKDFVRIAVATMRIGMRRAK